MLQTDYLQLTIYDAYLPEEVTKLSDELDQIDKYLNDDTFVEPFIHHFHKTLGRPGTPVHVYLRMMYLKHRYDLGYETLVEQVSDSIKWRKFSRIPLNEKVADATTLMKLTKKFGPDTLDQFNKAIVQKAKKEKIIKARNFRVDTTVVESDIHYPTDAQLLQDGVRVITRTVRKLSQVSQGMISTIRDRGRSVKKQVLHIAKVCKRRSREVYQEVRDITAIIADTAEKVVKDAQTLLDQGKEARKSLKDTTAKMADSLTNRLEQDIDLVKQVIDQTRKVNEGNTHLKDRIVSLFDPDTRPIRKGKLKAPTEFGRKLLITESEEKVIVHYELYNGNPSDESLLVDSVREHAQVLGKMPRAVAADRGFSNAKEEETLKQMGVKKVSIPKRGKKNKERTRIESSFWFRRLQRFRAGGEATISHLKRCRGLSRSRLRGTSGSKSWVALGIMSQNLWRIAKIASN